MELIWFFIAWLVVMMIVGTILAVAENMKRRVRTVDDPDEDPDDWDPDEDPDGEWTFHVVISQEVPSVFDTFRKK